MENPHDNVNGAATANIRNDNGNIDRNVDMDDQQHGRVHDQGGQGQIMYPILQHVTFPEKLELLEDVSRADAWKLFKQVWENYEISSRLYTHPKRQRTAMLLTCFAPSALKVYNSLSFENDADRQDIDVVIRKMTEVCEGVVNQTYKRYLFNTRVQAPHESVGDYYSVLLQISQTCGFGELTPSLRARIVVGVSDPAIRKRLLFEKDLTLGRCMEICKVTRGYSNPTAAYARTSSGRW